MIGLLEPQSKYRDIWRNLSKLSFQNKEYFLQNIFPPWEKHWHNQRTLMTLQILTWLKRQRYCGNWFWIQMCSKFEQLCNTVIYSTVHMYSTDNFCHEYATTEEASSIQTGQTKTVFNQKWLVWMYLLSETKKGIPFLLKLQQFQVALSTRYCTQKSVL